MRCASTFIAVALLLTACSRADQGISTRLTARVDSAEQRLGFKWDANGKSSIGTNDGINLLVFVKGQEVVPYAEHPRHKGDFLNLDPRCLSRSKAQLLRRSGPGGRVQLVVAQA